MIKSKELTVVSVSRKLKRNITWKPNWMFWLRKSWTGTQMYTCTHNPFKMVHFNRSKLIMMNSQWFMKAITNLLSILLIVV